MKKLITIIGLTVSCLVCQGQTNTPSASTIWDVLTTGSNYWAAPFLTYSAKSHDMGYGLAVGYKVSQTINPVIRIDDFAGKLWVVSGNLELQLPRSLLGKFPIVPVAIVGAATSFGGNGANNGGAAAVVGAGVYFEWKSLSSAKWVQNIFSAADYERWVGAIRDDQQNQIRVAPVCIKF